MQKLNDLDVDFKKRTLLLGGTGSGKTKLMLDVAKSLEKECTVIFIDTKGDATEAFVRQTENVKVIDKNTSYNILKLDGKSGDRKHQVSLAKIRILDALNTLHDERTDFKLISKLLDQLYENNDSPTLEDLHKLLQDNGDKAPDALVFLSGEKELTNMFYRDDSLNLEELLTAGTSLAVKLPNCSSIVLTEFALQIIMRGIWNASRLRLTEKGKDTPIVIMIDEFTKIGNMEIINDIVKQGRTLGIGIILASQLGRFLNQDDTLDELIANCDNKIIGILSGEESQKLASLMGAIGIDSSFSSNGRFEWTLLSHSGDKEILVNFTTRE